MSKTEITDRAGKTMPLMEIDGKLYPNFPLESLKHVFDFKAKPDDVLLCAYSKSGTHWTYEIIRCLLAGTTDLPVVEKTEGFIEFSPSEKIINMPSPRNINSHFFFDKLSPEFINEKCKMIYVIRDPRDVVVSYYNHHMKMPQICQYYGDWDGFFHLFLEGKVAYGSWFEYIKGWEKAIAENPDHPILQLSFEDIKTNPVKEIGRIAKFLEIECSEQFLKEVAETTSFDAMNKKRNGANILYRKGQIGDWRNWFTVAQSEEFNQVFEREMAGTKTYELYSHTKQ